MICKQRREAEALAAQLEAEKAEIAEKNRRLEHLNDEFRKFLFGKQSEKLNADDRQLSFDDLRTAVSEGGGDPAAEGEAEPRRRQRPPRPAVRFPAHIERRTEVIEPASRPCACVEMTKIGEDRSKGLAIEGLDAGERIGDRRVSVPGAVSVRTASGRGHR